MVGKGERKKSGGLALCRRLREATQADCAGFWSMTPSMVITIEDSGEEVSFLQLYMMDGSLRTCLQNHTNVYRSFE